VAAGHTLDPDRFQTIRRELLDQIAGCFGRVEPRRTAELLVNGLLAGLPRTNCWTIAEHVGQQSPDRLQHFLSRAVWDHDRVRDAVRQFVVARLGRDRAVLVVDETGDVKKGTATVGVQRQYSGTAGRIENCQVAVFAVWATPRGAAFVDRQLYVPESWTEDSARCAAAGLPDDLAFATKPTLALHLVDRALDAGYRPAWVAGDEVYGNDPVLRGALEQRGLSYVLAVARSAPITIGPAKLRADALVAALRNGCWQLRSAGPGAKGQRWYQWAYLHLEPESDHGGQRYLLIRRNTSTGELAFYRCWSPVCVPLAALVATAGARWKVEEAFQSGKGLTGLDEHQVRCYTSWQRWTVLVMLAHAVLTITAAEQDDLPEECGLIPLTRNEIAHLIAVGQLATTHPPQHYQHWSSWRRRHQHRAQQCHYQRRNRLGL